MMRTTPLGRWAPGSWPETPLPETAKLDPRWMDSARELARQAAAVAPNFNIDKWSAVYEERRIADLTFMPARLDRDKDHVDDRTDPGPNTWDRPLARALSTQGFPLITPDTHLQRDSDSALVIAHVDADGRVVRTDEAWQARIAADGVFECSSYGRVRYVPGDPGYYRNSSYTIPDTDPRWTSTMMGVVAAGVPMVTCAFATLAELEQGYARRPLGFACLPARVDPGYRRWPAVKNDSGSSRLTPFGGRWRLPPNWVISDAKPRLVRFYEQVARDWGVVLIDTGGSLAFRAVPGSSPYLDGKASWQAAQLFPWGSLQLLAPGSSAYPVLT